MLHWASELGRFFGTTYAMENGYDPLGNLDIDVKILLEWVLGK
jgi:hypothetical protein